RHRRLGVTFTRSLQSPPDVTGSYCPVHAPRRELFTHGWRGDITDLFRHVPCPALPAPWTAGELLWIAHRYWICPALILNSRGTRTHYSPACGRTPRSAGSVIAGCWRGW